MRDEAERQELYRLVQDREAYQAGDGNRLDLKRQSLLSGPLQILVELCLGVSLFGTFWKSFLKASRRETERSAGPPF